MKKLLFVFLLFATAYSFATPPLLIKPGAATINVKGAIDTAITMKRLLLVEFVVYNGIDSTVNVSFSAYANAKEYARGNTIATNIPTVIAPFKLAGGSSSTIEDILKHAKEYYVALGYNVGVQ